MSDYLLIAETEFGNEILGFWKRNPEIAWKQGEIIGERWKNRKIEREKQD